MKPIAFIDRDGTLIKEPKDHQVDRLDKLELVEQVIPQLLRLQAAGFELVMVTNQDGLGTNSFPAEDFERPHTFMMQLFASQGVRFQEVLICPHRPEDQCDCRKPRLGMVLDYLRRTDWDRARSCVIGDRPSDLELATNMSLQGFQVNLGWKAVVDEILLGARRAELSRNTNETQIQMSINIDGQGQALIQTPHPFLNHMLEQIARHGELDLHIDASGDLETDDHHLVEDLGICLGEVFRSALGQKRQLERYAQVTVMDEVRVNAAIDLSGRSYCVWKGEFHRPDINGLATEMVPHFFRSFADSAKCTLHMEVEGENSHHQIEACFKALGRLLREASRQTRQGLPSTKGVL